MALLGLDYPNSKIANFLEKLFEYPLAGWMDRLHVQNSESFIILHQCTRSSRSLRLLPPWVLSLTFLARMAMPPSARKDPPLEGKIYTSSEQKTSFSPCHGVARVWLGKKIALGLGSTAFHTPLAPTHFKGSTDTIQGWLLCTWKHDRSNTEQVRALCNSSHDSPV